MKNSIWMFVLVFAVSGLFAQGTPQTRVVDGKTYLVHKVISGETFYKIAKKHGCTVLDLQISNPGIKVLHPGDEVLVPQKDAAVKPAAVNTPAAPNATQEYEIYKVKKGETLSKIARDHHTTVEELKRINKLGNTGLKIGQVIKIPVAAATPAAPVVEPAPADSNKPAKEPEVVVVKPQPTKEPEIKVDDKTNPGMPVSPKVTVQETAVEKEENGKAKVVTDKMDQSRTFVMHPFLPKGSIIVVINESNGKMAYCRVIDNISAADLGDNSLAITQAVADKIGMTSSAGNVKIKYAAP